MQPKNLQQIPIQLRDEFNKLAKTTSRADIDTAIGLMRNFIKANPEVTPARERLRELEKRKTAMMSSFEIMMAKVTTAFSVMSARGKIGKDPVAAMAACEDVLAKCLNHPSALMTLADAAIEADAPFIAVEAMVTAREYNSASEAVLRKLCFVLQKNGQAREGYRVFQEIASRHPGNIKIQTELRAAAALASLEKGKWDSEDVVQENISESKEAAAQLLLEGTIHDEKQARMLIEKFEADLKVKDSADVRKRLADAYMVAGDFAAARKNYKSVAEIIGAMDPTIDKAIEKAYVAEINQGIEELTKNPAAYDQPEAQKQNLIAERDKYMLERAAARVAAYPNDSLLHYDLAIQYFDRGDIQAALPEFQQAVKSPKIRTNALIYLGRCFAVRKQYDIAGEQFATALKEMVRMDGQKMDTLYFLGNMYEEAGNMDKAVEAYKEIYQSQADFKDVAARIERYYAAQK